MNTLAPCPLLLMAVLAVAAPPVHAAGPAWQAVDASRLAAARGGFTTPSGLALSLGIERSVTINGELVSQATLHIADVRALDGAQAGAVRAALAPVLIQRGGGVVDSAMAGPMSAGTVVQNALNDQVIGTRTVINTTVNSASLLKEINFLSSVRDAGVGALAPR